jgi:hypothetical protein
MPERHLAHRAGLAMRLDAFDAPPQTRKRVRACAAHAPLLKVLGRHRVLSDEPATGSFVHDMF